MSTWLAITRTVHCGDTHENAICLSVVRELSFCDTLTARHMGSYSNESKANA